MQGTIKLVAEGAIMVGGAFNIDMRGETPLITGVDINSPFSVNLGTVDGFNISIVGEPSPEQTTKAAK